LNLFLNKKVNYFKYQDIFALFCLIVTVIFLIWKSQYGFGFDDESFYIAFAHRLSMGDALLTDEWHIAQFTGLLLYLPLKAYVAIAGSTEGIVLFFRYIFVVMQSVVAFIIYGRLRKYGLYSLFAALIYLLHIPLITLMGMGYYSIGLAFVSIAGLLIATTTTFGKLTFFLTGLFFAVAVLCNPLLAFLYFVYTICVVIFEINQKSNCRLFGCPDISFSKKTWLWMTLGIVFSAIIVLIFIFSRTSITQIIKNFPMFLTDPEHQANSSIFSLPETLTKIITINPYLFTALSILTIIIFIDKKRFIHRPFYILAGSIVFIFYLISTTYTINFPN